MKKISLTILFILLIITVYFYNVWLIPYLNLKKGFVIVHTFNCPNDHPIKANLRSMIYHLPYGTYYSRTNAANGYCFDIVSHAVTQGFRGSYNN